MFLKQRSIKRLRDTHKCFYKLLQLFYSIYLCSLYVSRISWNQNERQRLTRNDDFQRRGCLLPGVDGRQGAFEDAVVNLLHFGDTDAALASLDTIAVILDAIFWWLFVQHYATLARYFHTANTKRLCGFA